MAAAYRDSGNCYKIKMTRTSPLLPLLAALVLSGALGSAARTIPSNPVHACEWFKPETCKEHAPHCSLCKLKFADVELCFEARIAQELSPDVFSCSPTPVEQAAAADADSAPNPLPPVICEALAPAECATHTDTCSVCKNSFSGLDLCFAQATAATLPPQVFSCDPEPAPKALAQAGKPVPQICEVYNADDCKAHSDACTWCKKAFIGIGICFPYDIASTLPPEIFSCDPPSPPETEAETAQELAAEPSAPNPIPPIPIICNMFNATTCLAHPGCALCTNAFTKKQTCFNATMASKLPPQIFKCEAADAPEPAYVSETPANPLPPIPEICEMYNATECAQHTNCSLCVNQFIKVSVCFETKIAKKLPPQIFKCDLPPAPAPEPEPEALAPSLLAVGKKPIDGCTLFNATECPLHAANCSLCSLTFGTKKICVSYNTSAKLPPPIFKCTPRPSEPAVESSTLAVDAPNPLPPKPAFCGAYNATECLLHPGDCALCTQVFTNATICFNSTVAKALPPQIFKCSLEPAPGPILVSEENADACYRLDEAACGGSPDCAWCDSDRVPSACYYTSKARRFPGGLFQCKFSAVA